MLNFLQQLALTVARAQLKRVLFFNGGAVCGIGHHHSVFPQMLGGFTRIGQDALFEDHQFDSEKCHLRIVHVVLVGHGHDFSIAQLVGFFGFPIVGQLGIFFNGHEGRGCQSLCGHVL